MIKYIIFDLLGVLTPMDETKRAIVEKLREQNLKLAAISNLQPVKAKEIADYYGLDDLYLSRELELSKASPEIYRKFLLDHEVDAEDCMFIDDSLENLLAAKKAGLKVVWYAGEASLQIDYAIVDLAEISEIIKDMK